MTKVGLNNTIDKPQAHAKLRVMLSLLKAFKLVELLTLLNSLLAIFAIVYSPIFQLKVLASAVLIVGLVIFYYALRVRIDITLFEHWDSLEIGALDDALTNINSKHQSGRALGARLQGSYRLFNQGLSFLIAQFCLLMLAVWYI